MRVITIPDLHGKDCWKKIAPDEYDKIIFLGDYADSFTISSVEIIKNIEEIIEFKTSNPNKVELLLGNHDMHYLYYPAFRCAGFSWKTQVPLTKLFRENRELFNFAFQIDNHLWTHAGVSNSWFKDNYVKFEELIKEEWKSELAGIFNKLGGKDIHILTTVSFLRDGDSMHGGILWADLKETYNDYLDGFHQYVGHTKVPGISRFRNEAGSICYLDCLDTKESFYSFEI